MSSIQTVSLKKLFGDPKHEIPRDDWLATAEEFGKALKHIGFAYLTDHDIAEESIVRAFKTSKQFFKLPLETKKSYPRDMDTLFHGYTPIGKESFARNPLPELRETFDVAITNSPQCKYPDNELPEFRFALNDLLRKCSLVMKKLLKLLAITLKMEDEEYFINRHKILEDNTIANYTQLRTLFYPPVPDNVITGTVRCGEHTDFGTFTLLFQDELGGLEVQKDGGGWEFARPIPGSILLNTGDLVHHWTGGMIPSTFHRVVVPEEEVRRRTARQSIAFFAKPDNDTEILPLIKTASDSKYNTCKKSDILRAGEHFLNRTAFTAQAAPIKI